MVGVKCSKNSRDYIPMDDYTPYDLVPLTLNGNSVWGRPIRFSGEPVNGNMDAFGRVVKPTAVVTTCPVCGGGLELDVTLGDPPFSPYYCNCHNCRPMPKPLDDPFVNPINEGYITREYLNQMSVVNIDDAADLKSKVEVPPDPEPSEEPVSESLADLLADDPKPQVEAADGIDEEEEFDDSDMVEPE